MKKAHAPRPGIVGFVARELGAYALHGALGALHKPRLDERDGDSPTILFVHGHGGGGGAFALLERALRARGHHRFAAWDYRSIGTIDDLAAKLDRFVRSSLGGEVHVVGHSLGGIISRVWLQELGGRELARSFVTLSTPHRGLSPLPGARVVPLVREITGMTPLLTRLENGVASLGDLRCLAIVSCRDHFVRPWRDAGFGTARVVPVSDAGHVGVLFSSEVHDLVAAHLEETAKRR